MSVVPTVFVVEDDQDVRDSLARTLASVDLPYELFSSATEFLDTIDLDRPGCLVTDIRMPGMSGLDLQSFLSARKNALPVIIITGFADVPVAVKAMKVGAVDFLEKPFSSQVFLDAVRKALAVDARDREQRRIESDIEARVARLTPREKQVLKLVVAGNPNKLIAYDLGLSPKTVEFHRANVMSKMSAESVAELVQMVLGLEEFLKA